MLTVTHEDAGSRLDVFVAKHFDMTRSRAINHIKDGLVTIGGVAQCKAGYQMRIGDEVFLERVEPTETPIEPQPLALRIVYQDAALAVVYKPSGMVVHPAAGNHDGTMVNALLYHLDGLSGIGGVIRPGIVHRIDKDTSGLLLVAKNDKSHLHLSEQIRRHEILRAYWAIIIGNTKADEGVVDAEIARHKHDRKKMAIVSGGKSARTSYQVLKRLRGACLIEARLSTGRTHQIRVHMASLGHPVLGDPVYGPKKSPYPIRGGQLLHARTLGFIHPDSGEWMEFSEPPEPRFITWLEKLKNP